MHQLNLTVMLQWLALCKLGTAIAVWEKNEVNGLRKHSALLLLMYGTEVCRSVLSISAVYQRVSWFSNKKLQQNWNLIIDLIHLFFCRWETESYYFKFFCRIIHL